MDIVIHFSYTSFVIGLPSWASMFRISLLVGTHWTRALQTINAPTSKSIEHRPPSHIAGELPDRISTPELSRHPHTSLTYPAPNPHRRRRLSVQAVQHQRCLEISLAQLPPSATRQTRTRKLLCSSPNCHRQSTAHLGKVLAEPRNWCSCLDA
jgi:hypothetical protein